MYIVTFEQYVPINLDCGYYERTFKEFTTMEKAEDFVAEIHEFDKCDVRKIHLWDAKEIKVDIDELLD